MQFHELIQMCKNIGMRERERERERELSTDIYIYYSMPVVLPPKELETLEEGEQS